MGECCDSLCLLRLLIGCHKFSSHQHSESFLASPTQGSLYHSSFKAVASVMDQHSLQCQYDAFYLSLSQPFQTQCFITQDVHRLVKGCIQVPGKYFRIVWGILVLNTFYICFNLNRFTCVFPQRKLLLLVFFTHLHNVIMTFQELCKLEAAGLICHYELISSVPIYSSYDFLCMYLCKMVLKKVINTSLENLSGNVCPEITWK